MVVRRRAQAGYTLVALVIGMAVLTILLAAVGPLLSTIMKRDREEELIFRGRQYARAIQAFQKRYGRFPNTLKEMMREPAAHDPQALEGSDVPLRQLEAADPRIARRRPVLRRRPARPAAAGPARRPGGAADPDAERLRLLRPAQPGPANGPIVGVRSKVHEEGLRQWRGYKYYDEWSLHRGRRRQRDPGRRGRARSRSLCRARSCPTPTSEQLQTRVRREWSRNSSSTTASTVLVDEMQDVRSFALGFFVRAGSGEEAAARRGISHFLEHVLFKRTSRRSTVAIAREIDRLGGDVDAFTTKEYTGFYAHSLDANFAEALDLLADLVLSPAFEAEDVEVERGVILEEIGEANDNPDDLVHELFVRAFWKTHPSRRADPRHASRRSDRSASTDLHRYHRDRYGPAT